VLRREYIDLKGGTFMKCFSIGLAAATVLAVLVQDVAAAPNPAYNVTCIVGGQTSATWRHAKLDQATFEWFTAGSTTAYATLSVPLSPHPPHGSILTSAGTIPGIVPATVRVSFERANTSGSDPVEMPCR
jgi:hypothetical protein